MDKSKAKSAYKGKPLIRSGNILYYGDPTQPYVAMLQIVTTQPLGDTQVPDRVAVSILSTDESVHSSKRILKRTEKIGLYNALAIAAIWLERSLSPAK